jgi:hypothetical protein
MYQCSSVLLPACLGVTIAANPVPSSKRMVGASLSDSWTIETTVPMRRSKVITEEVCLLRIEPAGSLPSLAKKYVIVNLQETPMDQEAAMVIRGRVDDVMGNLMQQLGYPDWDKGDSPPIERLYQMPCALDTDEK